MPKPESCIKAVSKKSRPCSKLPLGQLPVNLTPTTSLQIVTYASILTYNNSTNPLFKTGTKEHAFRLPEGLQHPQEVGKSEGKTRGDGYAVMQRHCTQGLPAYRSVGSRLKNIPAFVQKATKDLGCGDGNGRKVWGEEVTPSNSAVSFKKKTTPRYLLKTPQCPLQVTDPRQKGLHVIKSQLRSQTQDSESVQESVEIFPQNSAI